jgi:hypothetical protein
LGFRWLGNDRRDGLLPVTRVLSSAERLKKGRITARIVMKAVRIVDRMKASLGMINETVNRRGARIIARNDAKIDGNQIPKTTHILLQVV